MVRDEQYMALALEAARRGDPSPNPHVGAVLVRDDQVLSVGHHARAGEAHAEVAAIGAAGDASGATLYVTLDPCNHDGRTGPCTEAIISAGVSRVVIGSDDPAPHVPGAVERLEAAGVQVERGILESACDWVLAPFRKHITTKLPHVTLKAALTMDGRMATRTGDSRWVTGEAARVRVHELRAVADAILVGVGTVLADDPLLTVRHVSGRDPVRVVIDSKLRTPPSAAMLHAASSAPTWVAHVPGVEPERVHALIEAGAELICVEAAADSDGVSLDALVRVLGARDIVKLLVEGGSDVHGSFLRSGLADRVALFMAPRVLGDPEAVPFARAGAQEEMARAWRISAPRYEVLGDDLLVEGNLTVGGAG